MGNWLFSYRSFLSENVETSQMSEDNQMDAVEKCIEERWIKTDGPYRWSKYQKAVNFEKNLRVTAKANIKSLLDLPFKIGEVNYFDCSELDFLKDLKGGPTSCSYLNCSYCGLTSLEGSPITLVDINAESNLITSLNGGPKYVIGNFNVRDNMLKDLNYGPYYIGKEIGLIGNKRIVKEGIGLEYVNMHKDIKSIYGDDTKRIIEDISDKKYAFSVLVKDPKYSKFLKEFQDEIEEWEFLKQTKDFGLI